MITLKQLQCFVQVVKTDGFYNASLALNLTQPSVTKAVTNLEDTLGVQLFIKATSHRKREIELTEIGQIVHDQAIAVLQQVNDIFQSVDDYQHMAQGKLRLGVSPLGGEVLTTAITDFYQQYPNIELSLIEKGAESLKNDLINNELDVATLMKPIADDFESMDLCSYPVMAVMCKSRVSKQTKQISLKSLQNAPFILLALNSSFTAMILEQCYTLGFEPKIICHTNQLALLLSLVKQNMGVTLLPKFYTDKIDDSQLVCLPVTQPSMDWQLVMAWRRHRPLTPSIRAWLSVLLQEFG